MAVEFPNPPSQMPKPQGTGRAQPVVVRLGPPAPWEQQPHRLDVFAAKAKAKYGPNWRHLPEISFQEGEKRVCYDKNGEVIPCAPPRGAIEAKLSQQLFSRPRSAFVKNGNAAQAPAAAQPQSPQ